ncbi:MAG TPA: hypothetical protein VGK30_05945 [Candidatus Binatia bacterium]
MKHGGEPTSLQFSSTLPQTFAPPPQTLGVPPPPHVADPVHVPQSTVPPQPSGTVPQSSPAGHDVIGVQPHTCSTPPPSHVSGDVQDPQSNMSEHVPSEIMPQFAPWAAHVVPVQHVPKDCAAGLTHTRPQQL